MKIGDKVFIWPRKNFAVVEDLGESGKITFFSDGYSDFIDNCMTLEQAAKLGYHPPKEKKKVTMYRYTYEYKEGFYSQGDWVSEAVKNRANIVKTETKEIEV